jgi:hypothetical protein
VATVAELPRRVIRFAGLRWSVKRARDPVGPGPNRFDDSSESVDVDLEGNLVLRVRRTGSVWVCAEVVAEEATGYGTYEWTIRSDLCGLDRNVVLGMFTWSDEPDQSHRELDIEASAWGRGEAPVGQFVVQPSASPGHLQTFAIPRSASSRCSFDWSPGQVTLRATDAQPWTFAGNAVPRPGGGVRPRINLWLHDGINPHRDTPATVTIGSFSFTARNE